MCNATATLNLNVLVLVLSPVVVRFALRSVAPRRAEGISYFALYR
jgi:hypothetical protein